MKMKRIFLVTVTFLAVLSCKKKEVIVEEPKEKHYTAKVIREMCDDYPFYHIVNGTDTIPANPSEPIAERTFQVKTGDLIELKAYYVPNQNFFCQILAWRLYLDGVQVAYVQSFNDDVFLTYVVE